MSIQEIIINSAQEAIDAVAQLQRAESIHFIERSAQMLAECFQRGNKVIIAGNGGSLCDGAHFAEELTGQFRSARRALPAISLSEPGHITCVGNDMGFSKVFSRGIEAFGQPGDVFVGLTTSGNSENIIYAFEAARQRDMRTIAFLGKTGGRLKGCADLELLIEGFPTSDRIQEAHMAAIHIIIEAVECLLFSEQEMLTERSF